MCVRCAYPIPILCLIAVLFSFSASGQSTAFTFQGSLKNGANPATGNYDFEFGLFDVASGGTQLGFTMVKTNVPVSNGIFSVQLDSPSGFVTGVGNALFLEIRLRPTGSSAGFTILTPRQRIESVPTSITSINALLSSNAIKLGGVAADQYVITTDPRMADARNPLPNSTSYIQNQNAAPQASSNFSISGTGTANTFRASSVIASTSGGSSTATGAETEVKRFSNSNHYRFQGFRARGTAEAPGAVQDGDGIFSIEFGGFDGSNFGTSGTKIEAKANEPWSSTAHGAQLEFWAGVRGTAGAAIQKMLINDSVIRMSGPVGVGTSSPEKSLHIRGSGDEEIMIESSDVGGRKWTLQSSSGASGGRFEIVDRTASPNANRFTILSDGHIGIGTSAPEKHLHVRGSGDQEIMIQSSDAGGRKWSLQSSDGAAAGRFEIVDRTAGANRLAILANGDVGIGTTGPTEKLDVNGLLRVRNLRGGGTNLCITSPQDVQPNVLANCTSSIKYKSDVSDLYRGLNVLTKLRPVGFYWKSSGERDIGLVAEEVAEVDPQLATYTADGEVLGVKYDRIGVLLINAVKEQQAQIEALHKRAETSERTISSLRSEIRTLRRIAARKRK